ncbi:MAG: LPXTG cell wall anchor domain-containing protein [Coriobacteriales bacterium]|jgi:LPXTG-motif cell wall-anchored protein|nr:LPXTG cell wall anchor domain-containing protein [Coriobacteriales bacterium]
MYVRAYYSSAVSNAPAQAYTEQTIYRAWLAFRHTREASFPIEVAIGNVTRLLGMVGDLSSVTNFDGQYQHVQIPVHADPASPGSFISDATYAFAPGHSITLDTTGAHYDAASGHFITTITDTQLDFTTALGSGHFVTGVVEFIASDPDPDLPAVNSTGASSLPATGDTGTLPLAMLVFVLLTVSVGVLRIRRALQS